jgi:2-hydroxy-3-keto-5-methylthiopentenyl-1-phosphate phosphatase
MNRSPKFEVYFDFDNTITEFDVLDDIIGRFSINDDWKRIEEAWESGAIGSRECLEQQLAQVRISGAALHEYLETVRVDPAFPRIIDWLRTKGVAPMILSDSFTSIISGILENNGIDGLSIRANEMRLDGDRPVVAFPYYHSICTKCANCKTSHLFRRDRPEGTRKIYVGDGLSDACPAGFCEILFAKDKLLKHFLEIRRDCIPFRDLGTVYSHLQTLMP